jgi:AcrR family transcriptional regulator
VGKGQLTHQAILDESVQLASRLGLLGLSVGGLADEVEMSKSGLFAHFRSKQQLQLETLAHARSLFIDVVIRPTRNVPDGEPRLRALVDRWFRWADESLAGGCLFVAAAVELDDRPGPLRDALVTSEREWRGLLRSVVQSAVDRGEFASDLDPDQFSYELHALMLAYHHSSRLLTSRDEAATRTRSGLERLISAARPTG